jgi:hypothetical protein
MDSMGALPVRIFPHALNISRGEMLGLGFVASIPWFDASQLHHDAPPSDAFSRT